MNIDYAAIISEIKKQIKISELSKLERIESKLDLIIKSRDEPNRPPEVASHIELDTPDNFELFYTEINKFLSKYMKYIENKHEFGKMTAIKNVMAEIDRIFLEIKNR